MKKSLLLLLCCALSILSQAQSKFNVSGIVMEKGTNEPIPSATVRILSLPDSTMVTGAATDLKGAFNIQNVKKGKYALKVTFVGYNDHVLPLDLTSKKEKNVSVGYITLTDDTRMLKEAVVSANAAQVQVSGDSLVFNASAFRTSEGSALEELVKKLPGAEIDADGNITINGKTVTKILVDGKEFFLNDKNLALKNIPTKIVDKIKSYDRKSDLARVTGIDDGEEETVLDLTIKKGMNQGWFGNIDLALGTERRYTEKLMLSRFSDTRQYTLIGSANNTGDRGFGGGGGRGWGWGGNGLQAYKDLGFNFATVTDGLETGGNVRMRYSGSDTQNKSSVQNFVTQTGAFTRSESINKSSNISVNLDLRFEWKPDTMTNIIFRPSANYSRNRGFGSSRRATFNDNPDLYSAMSQDPLTYAEKGVLLNTDTLFNLIVNTNASTQQTYSNSKGFNGELQANRKFGTAGRNLTFRATGGFSDSQSKQLSAANIGYHKTGTTTSNNRYYATPAESRNYALQVTYSEPIAYKTYLQFSYRFNYSYSKNDREANVWANDVVQYYALQNALQSHRYDVAGALDAMLQLYPSNADHYTDSVANRLSQYSEYRNYNHTASISFRKVGDQYNLSFGVDFLPQHSTLNYKYMGKEYPEVKRTVYNVAPSLDFKYDFDKPTQFRIWYRGRTNQPSMTNLLDITDDSDPLNISKGNPGLKPSFNHNMRLNFNTYNADLQQGIFAFGGVGLTQNSISNRTSYNPDTGVRTTMPENINGNWNSYLGFGFNRGLGEKKYFTVNSFTMLNYNHQVSYLDPKQYTEEESKTNQLGVNQRLSFGFRKEWFEISANGNMNYNHSRNNVVSNSNLDTWNFSYGAEMNLNFDFGLSFTTDVSQSSRRGFSTAAMNTNEFLWNAKLSYSFLKGRALTFSFEWNDILQNRSNISRALTAMSSSDTEYNAIYSYAMFHVIYKLNIFGGKNANGTENAKSMDNFRPQRGFGGGGGRGRR
ncbi:MAG: TonB-dependent receptor [Bacteroidaceae bacterium]|nr:TonB-dependent receptor [Bacteroidaceae bacterium]MBQ9642400.1 TonB-dependent receptor [Bacteroidaceae bacterium]